MVSSPSLQRLKLTKFESQIESSKVSKKPKYNSMYIYIYIYIYIYVFIYRNICIYIYVYIYIYYIYTHTWIIIYKYKKIIHKIMYIQKSTFPENYTKINKANILCWLFIEEMTGKKMIWLKWKTEILQAQKMRLNVEIRLFSISSANTITTLTLSIKCYYFPMNINWSTIRKVSLSNSKASNLAIMLN